MSIKICVLSDGVRVIGDFYEVTSQFKKVVGYAIIHPQIISMTRTVPSSMVKQTNEPQFNVQFSPWNPFAKNQFFRLNMDRVVSVSDVREDILTIYKEQFYVEKYLDDLIPDEPLERIIYDDSNR
tara:strand:- start:2449 stop:2823 length:375 start_codon:yes stop_codon:yes gene_type:complete